MAMDCTHRLRLPQQPLELRYSTPNHAGHAKYRRRGWFAGGRGAVSPCKLCHLQAERGEHRLLALAEHCSCPQIAALDSRESPCDLIKIQGNVSRQLSAKLACVHCNEVKSMRAEIILAAQPLFVNVNLNK